MSGSLNTPGTRGTLGTLTPPCLKYGLLHEPRPPLERVRTSMLEPAGRILVATVTLPGGFVASTTAVATLVAATLLATACGSSSQTETLTAPSSSKCSTQVTVEGAPFSAAGGSGSIRVSANRDCQWAAKTDASWVTLTQPTAGQGDGSVRFSVGTNADPNSRSASLAVNDQSLDISQAGTPCELRVSSNHESVDPAGADVSIAVGASAASCGWTAASNASWIAITSGRDGHGDGTVAFHVDAVSGSSRSGTLTIAGQVVQIDQGTGAPGGPGCTFGIATDTFHLDGAGGDRQVAVTAPAGCSWTAQSRSPWITITSGATGSGSGVMAFHVPSSDGPERSGVLVVANHAITVVQSLACSYSITPSSASVGAQSAGSTIQVQTGAGCAWTAVSAVPWISVAGGASGNGPGPVQVAAAANDGPSRTGTITIAGQPFTITQANGCTYSVTPASQTIGGGGGNVTATVTAGAGCSWSADSSVDWITVGTSSGTGSRQVSLSVKPNLSPPRTGTVSIAGRTVTVTQASQCSWSFAPNSTELPRTGGTGNVLVLVTGKCSWTAVPNVPWIQVTAGGSGVGNGLLQFVVPSNPNASRTGIIAIGGVDYTVHQAGSGDSQPIK